MLVIDGIHCYNEVNATQAGRADLFFDKENLNENEHSTHVFLFNPS